MAEHVTIATAQTELMQLGVTGMGSDVVYFFDVDRDDIPDIGAMWEAMAERVMAENIEAPRTPEANAVLVLQGLMQDGLPKEEPKLPLIAAVFLLIQSGLDGPRPLVTVEASSFGVVLLT